MTELISNKGPNGEPLTDTNGDPIQGAEIIAVHQGGTSAFANTVIAVTTTDANGEYAFTDDDLPTTYKSGGSPKTEYIDLYARIGTPSNPRQAVPIRPHQGYQNEAQLITSFEVGDLSSFPNGDTGAFAVNQNSPVYDGSYSLKANGTNFPTLWSYEGEGLNYYPQRGDKWAYDFEFVTSGGQFIPSYGFSSGDDPRNDSYIVLIREQDDDIVLQYRNNGNRYDLASQGTLGLSPNTRYRHEVEFLGTGENPNHIHRLYEVSTATKLTEITGKEDSLSGRALGVQTSNTGATPEVVTDNWSLIV